MKSLYPGKCKDCGVEHKKGDEINKNSNGNWCGKGQSCNATMQLSGSVPPPSSQTTASHPDTIDGYAYNDVEPPKTPQESILEECKAFYEDFMTVDAERFESLAKIYISRMMSQR